MGSNIRLTVQILGGGGDAALRHIIVTTCLYLSLRM